MNERIQKLAEQAGLTFVNSITDDNEDIECVADTNGGLPCSTELEKFAELIIRECVSICEKDGQWYTNTGWLAEAGEALSLSEQIKEHFRVK